MQTNKLKLIVLFIFIVSGCVTGQNHPSSKTEAPEETGREQNIVPEAEERFEDTGNSYYYYMMAVLKQRSGDRERTLDYLRKAISNDARSSYLKMELLKMYLFDRDIDQALNVLNDILDHDPENKDALLILGKLKYEQEDLNAVVSAYERLIALDPEQKRVYLMLGEVYMNQGNLERAEELYKELVHRYPEFYGGYFYMGKIHLAEENYEKAEAAFLKTIELQPDLEEPRYELLNIYEKRNQKEKAFSIYEDMLEQNPDNPRLLLGMGLYYKDVHPERSAAVFKELGERTQHEPEILKLLIQEYFKDENYADAIVALSGMLAAAPDNSEMHYFLGVAYGEIKDGESAMAHFEKVEPTSKYYGNAVVHQVYWLQEWNKMEEAARFLEGALENRPENTAFIGYLAAVYEDMEAYDKAKQILAKGLELEPDNVSLNFRLGVVYDKMGEKDACMETMRRVIDLDPKHSSALNYLGYTYAEMGENLDEAERLIKSALEYRPDDGYIMDSLGWVHYQRGEYDQAVKILKQAADLVPDDPIILEHVGDAFVKTNNDEKALEYYRRSLSNKKDGKEVLIQKIKELEERFPGK